MCVCVKRVFGVCLSVCFVCGLYMYEGGVCMWCVYVERMCVYVNLIVYLVVYRVVCLVVYILVCVPYFMCLFSLVVCI